MGDIFLSYAHEDLERARILAGEFEGAGWSVFWDRRIPPGRTFEDYIEQRINECRVVVVLWSPRSVASNWVRLEAAHGRDKNPPILIPILIAPTTIPFAFRQIQAADLTSWLPGTKSVEFDEVISSIDTLAPRKTLSEEAPESPPLRLTEDDEPGRNPNKHPHFNTEAARGNADQLSSSNLTFSRRVSLWLSRVRDWALQEERIRQAGLANTVIAMSVAVFELFWAFIGGVALLGFPVFVQPAPGRTFVAHCTFWGVITGVLAGVNSRVMQQRVWAMWAALAGSVGLCLFITLVLINYIPYEMGGALNVANRVMLFSLFEPLAVVVVLINTLALTTFYVRRRRTNSDVPIRSERR